MNRPKIGLLGLSATVVGMMMLTSAAQGATLSWLVLNSSHTTATELKAELIGEKDSEHVMTHAEVAGLKVVLTCTAFTFNGFSLELGGKVTENGKVIFSGCKAYKEAPLTGEYKCTAKSPGQAAGTIETAGLKGGLVLAEGEPQIKAEPLAGPTGTLKTIRFEGAECVLPEAILVHGTIFLKDCEGFATTHRVKHLIEAGKMTTLYFGAHTAKQLEVTKLLGSAWVKLGGAHGGLEWSAMDA